jgi:hypothetical protein
MAMMHFNDVTDASDIVHRVKLDNTQHFEAYISFIPRKGWSLSQVPVIDSRYFSGVTPPQ